MGCKVPRASGTYRWNILVPVPQTEAILHRTGDDAYPAAGRCDPGDPGRLVEEALGNELRLPVTRLTGDVEGADRLLRHGAATPPCANGGNARDEEEERLAHGSEAQLDEIAYAADVWLKGREGPVEVDGPLVIWKLEIQRVERAKKVDPSGKEGGRKGSGAETLTNDMRHGRA